MLDQHIFGTQSTREKHTTCIYSQAGPLCRCQIHTWQRQCLPLCKDSGHTGPYWAYWSSSCTPRACEAQTEPGSCWGRHRQSLEAAGCSAVLCTLSAVGLTALSGMSPMDPPLLQPTGTSAGTPRVRPKGVREELWGPGHHTAASHLCLGRC